MEHKTYHGRPVIWSPQPRQAAFMARTEDEALYGGAAGGGKSDALIIEALRQVHIPHYRALILRKTYPQLSELIDKTIPNLVYDESNVEDIDTTQEDHIYDECRYVLMENPISAAKHTQPPPMLDDPLDMDPRKDKTRFMRI